MTAPAPPVRRTITARTQEILHRCYRNEPGMDVLERALRMLATADGHLDPAGRIRTAREADRARRQP